MSNEEIFVIGTGVALVLFALLVEIERKYIWNNYKKNYHKHDNAVLEMLMKPNIWVYRLNIYFVWPLVLILGVWIIVQNA